MELTELQRKVLKFIQNSPAKILGLEAPTGFGKTVLALSLAKEEIRKGKSVVITTFTKALQNQYLQEIKKHFKELENKTVVFKGKGNFICRDKLELEPEFKRFYEKNGYLPEKIREKFAVDEYCSKAYRSVCPFREKCEYVKMLKDLEEKPLIIANHFLLPQIKDRANVLIIDEVHHVDQAFLEPKEISLEFLKGYVREEWLEKFQIEAAERELIEKFRRSIKEGDARKAQFYQGLLIRLQRTKEELQNAKLKDGKLVSVKETKLHFENEKVIYMSGTFPETFICIPPPEDFVRVSGRSLEGVIIEVEDVDYRQPDYYARAVAAIEELLSKHGRVLVLATSKKQLEELEKRIEIKTTLHFPPFKLVEEFNRGKTKVIGGTEVFWTGINCPGEKGIVIMKLPFDPPERLDGMPKKEALMLERAKNRLIQGIGRMKRTEECRGTVKILDRRIVQYEEFMKVLERMEERGAEVRVKVRAQELRVVA